jgi:hypothetical protein
MISGRPLFIQRTPEHFVVVETSQGRRALRRSTGQRSGHPGKKLPFDEVIPMNKQLSVSRVAGSEAAHLALP